MYQGFVFPPGSWPNWADHNMWAPEIHFVSGLLSSEVSALKCLLSWSILKTVPSKSLSSQTPLHAGRYLVYFSASAANGRHSIGVKSIFEHVLTVIPRPYMMTKTKGGNIHKRQPLGSLWGLGKPSGLPQWGQFGNHHRLKVIIIITSFFCWQSNNVILEMVQYNQRWAQYIYTLKYI